MSRVGRPRSLGVFCAVLAVAVAARGALAGALDVAAVRTAATVFVAVCVQALPFLVLGTLLSGVLTLVGPGVLRRLVPARPLAAAGVGGAAGLLLPGCECASVPVARRLAAGGVPEAAALAFLLAAPAINPVVLVATVVAFPGHPELAVARFLASALTAVVVGWSWPRVGGRLDLARRLRDRPDGDVDGRSPWAAVGETARHDLLAAGGLLVLGALAAAVATVVLPASWLVGLAGHVVVAVPVMALLAVVLALCSEADAFVAAALGPLPLAARLVFLVVGPAVDLKLVALHVGEFGSVFAARFVPLALGVAVGAAVAVGAVTGALVPGGVR